MSLNEGVSVETGGVSERSGDDHLAAWTAGSVATQPAQSAAQSAAQSTQSAAQPAGTADTAKAVPSSAPPAASPPETATFERSYFRAPYWLFKSFMRFLERAANGIPENGTERFSEQFVINELASLHDGQRLAMLRALRFFGLVHMNGRNLGTLRFTAETQNLRGASPQDLVAWAARAVDDCYNDLWVAVEDKTSNEDWLKAVYEVYGYTGSMATRTLIFLKRMLQFSETKVSQAVIDALDGNNNIDLPQKAVRAYLETLTNTQSQTTLSQSQPTLSQKSISSISTQIENINKHIESTKNVLTKLDYLQERHKLETLRQKLVKRISLQELEADFIKYASDYSQREGIQYTTWREFGVPPSILRRAGIVRST